MNGCSYQSRILLATAQSDDGSGRGRSFASLFGEHCCDLVDVSPTSKQRRDPRRGALVLVARHVSDRVPRCPENQAKLLLALLPPPRRPLRSLIHGRIMPTDRMAHGCKRDG